METKVYKPVTKKFLKQDVRVIKTDDGKEYIICKDMFDVLGLASKDGTWSMPKRKMLEFLDGIDEKESCKSFAVLLKQGKAKVTKEVDCLNIEVAPTVLTQFKPTQRRGKEILDTWFNFMKFVNMLLKYHECHKYIIDDKERQKLAIEEITNNGGNAIITNKMVNRIMGKLITDNDNFSIKKDELKIYQPQTTIDLLEVRNFVMDKFSTCYALTGHHDKARDLTFKLAQKKYFNE